MISSEHTATGRPSQPIPGFKRATWSLGAIVMVAELITQVLLPSSEEPGPVGGLLRPVLRSLSPWLAGYLSVRHWVLTHHRLALTGTVVAVVMLAGLYRGWLLLWHNQIRARLSGTYFSAEVSGFPVRRFSLIEQVRRRPKGHTFVGMTPTRGWLRWKWRPFYLPAQQRSMHTHVLGKTGSGKTASVLWPQVLQDALEGKGVLLMDAKGSDENVRTIKAIAAIAGREAELRTFCLPAWNQPHLFSHTWNMVYVRPRTPTDDGGDAAAMAERVFSVLSLGDNEYYNTQAQLMFTNLCRLLHGVVDERGYGEPFVMRDIAVCLKGIGSTDAAGDPDGFALALADCVKKSKEREAARDIENQVQRLGADVRKCFSGLVGAVDKFRSRIINAYQPDIIFEEVLERGGLVYVQLPGNLFKLQAPAVGRAMLMDVQQEGSLRQVFRGTRSQAPFAVIVDEFYNFADLSIIDSLNKLRDANLHFTLAHQSIADLELVSREFATAVWDNTRTKFILNQDNPELCEKLSKSLGTHQVVEQTVRRQQGALFTSLTTGDASSKLVETFRLHPNAVKSLATCGQGYCAFGQQMVPLCFDLLPAEATADYPLERKRQDPAVGLRLEERFLADTTEKK